MTINSWIRENSVPRDDSVVFKTQNQFLAAKGSKAIQVYNGDQNSIFRKAPVEISQFKLSKQDPNQNLMKVTQKQKKRKPRNLSKSNSKPPMNLNTSRVLV